MFGFIFGGDMFSVMAGRAWQQVCELADDIVSAISQTRNREKAGLGSKISGPVP